MRRLGANRSGGGARLIHDTEPVPSMRGKCRESVRGQEARTEVDIIAVTHFKLVVQGAGPRSTGASGHIAVSIAPTPEGY